MKLSPKEVSLLTKEQLVQIINLLAGVIADKPLPQATMQMVVNLATELTFSSGAVVETLEHDEMVYTCVTGNVKSKLGLRLKADSSLSGSCIREKCVLVCHDSELDPRVDKSACREVGLRSMMVAPLIHNDRVFGVLKVFSPKTDAYDEIDSQILSVSAKIISDSVTSQWSSS